MSLTAPSATNLKSKIFQGFSQAGSLKAMNVAPPSVVSPSPAAPPTTASPLPTQPSLSTTPLPDPADPALSQDQMLDVIDQAIDEVGQRSVVVTQAVPGVTAEATGAATAVEPQSMDISTEPNKIVEPVASAESVVEQQVEFTPAPLPPQNSVLPDQDGVMAQAVAGQANLPDPAMATAPAPIASKKETYVVNTTENPALDANAGVQAVEQEPSPEISPEVESFLQQKQENIDKLTEEIVVADQQPISSQTKFPSKPVVVVPITAEERKLGQKKSPLFSLRWLVEWSVKIIKKFSGEVIYRQA